MAKRGRKREAKVEAVTPGRVKSFVDRVCRVLDEIDERRELVGEIYLEAKGIGYDTAIMRKVVTLHRMDPTKRAEQKALLETYLHALEQADRVQNRVAAGETLDSAAKAEGTSRATAHRIVSKATARNADAESEQIADLDGVITSTGVSPPVAAEQAPAEGQPTDTAAGSSAAPVSDTDESCGGLNAHQGASRPTALDDQPDPSGCRVATGPHDTTILPEGGNATGRVHDNTGGSHDAGHLAHQPGEIDEVHDEIPAAGEKAAHTAGGSHVELNGELGEAHGIAPPASASDDDLAIPVFLDNRPPEKRWAS